MSLPMTGLTEINPGNFWSTASVSGRRTTSDGCSSTSAAAWKTVYDQRRSAGDSRSSAPSSGSASRTISIWSDSPASRSTTLSAPGGMQQRVGLVALAMILPSADGRPFARSRRRPARSCKRNCCNSWSAGEASHVFITHSIDEAIHSRRTASRSCARPAASGILEVPFASARRQCATHDPRFGEMRATSGATDSARPQQTRAPGRSREHHPAHGSPDDARRPISPKILPHDQARAERVAPPPPPRGTAKSRHPPISLPSVLGIWQIAAMNVDPVPVTTPYQVALAPSHDRQRRIVAGCGEPAGAGDGLTLHHLRHAAGPRSGALPRARCGPHRLITFLIRSRRGAGAVDRAVAGSKPPPGDHPVPVRLLPMGDQHLSGVKSVDAKLLEGRTRVPAARAALWPTLCCPPLRFHRHRHSPCACAA